jgi:hypothetical protein
MLAAIPSQSKASPIFHPQKQNRPQQMSQQNQILLAVFENDLKGLGLTFTKEYPVMHLGINRRWRLDYFVQSPSHTCAIEVNGGQWIGGRHTNPVSYESDLEKLNAVQALGIPVFQFTYQMLKRKEHISVLKTFFNL